MYKVPSLSWPSSRLKWLRLTLHEFIILSIKNCQILMLNPPVCEVMCMMNYHPYCIQCVRKMLSRPIKNNGVTVMTFFFFFLIVLAFSSINDGITNAILSSEGLSCLSVTFPDTEGCTVHTRLKSMGHIRWAFMWHFASGSIVGTKIRSERKRGDRISSTFTQWYLCFIFAICSFRLFVWSWLSLSALLPDMLSCSWKWLSLYLHYIALILTHSLSLTVS